MSSEVILGRLDVFAVSRQRVEYLVQHFDPVATEPLLTGTLVSGSQDVLAELRDRLSAAAVTVEVVRYLLQRALLGYVGVVQMIQNKEKLLHAERAIHVNVGYAVAYLAFARYYKETGGSAVTLDQLVRKTTGTLQQILQTLMAIRQRIAEVIVELTDVLDQLEMHLMDLD